MPETRYLTIDDVLAIADAFFAALGYELPVLRGGGRELLDSAIARAQILLDRVQSDYAPASPRIRRSSTATNALPSPRVLSSCASTAIPCTKMLTTIWPSRSSR